MKLLSNATLGLALLTATTMGISAAAADSGAFTGTFEGRNKHITTGTVSIMKAENGSSVLILGEDFSLDGAPDPSVALVKGGKYEKSADLGKMTKIKGMQVYHIPDNIDWSTYNEVYIWCEKFSVSLGVAKIN